MSQPAQPYSLPEISASLPSLPTVALEVLRTCQDPEAEIGELAALLGRDPSLAGKVLQMANSAFYRRGAEVTSLQRAAMLLGLRAVKVLSLGFTLASELPQKGAPGGFDLGRYWHRSTMTAVVARSLAVASGFARAEEAFLCGLLSYLGKLGLAQGAPRQYATVIAEAGPWPSDDDELRVLGYTSTQVGGQILRDWGVPQLIVAGAATPNALDGDLADADEEEEASLARLVALAQLATGIFFSEDAGTVLARLTAEVERLYALDTEAVDSLLAELESELHETAGALSVQLPEGISYDSLLAEARRQMVAVSIDVMLDLRQASEAVDELSREREELERVARTDRLTGLANRQALEEFLGRCVSLRRRTNLPEHLGVIMVDIDRFKLLNDTYGHQVGDDALRVAASAMQEVVRESDLLARYGGEEFCVILPQSSPDGLRVAAERLRVAVEAAPLTTTAHGVIRMTVSLGGACLGDTRSGDPAARLVGAADHNLYRAKAAGRNRFVVTDDLV